MITFGGRPLNTYKGGMDWSRGIGDFQEPAAVQSKTTTESIAPAPITKATAPAQPAPITKAPAQSKRQPAPKPMTEAESMTPIIVEVNSESVTIDPPGSFDPTKEINKNSFQDPFKDLSYDELLKGHDDLLKLQNAMEIAKFNDRLPVKIFGKEIVSVFDFLYWLSGNLLKIMICILIFSMCFYMYQITQGVLDAYHTVVDGITKLMEDINNVALHLKIPGLNIKAGPFRIATPDIMDERFKLFGGMFDGPLRDMYRASAFTRSATELIIQILIEMVTGIVEMFPAILDGVANATSKISDAMN